MTVMTGLFAMGKRFAQWFVYLLVVGVFAGFVAVHTIAAGRVVPPRVPTSSASSPSPATASRSGRRRSGTSRSWSTTLKSNLDALIYAAVTAGVFGWLWPRSSDALARGG